MNTVLFSGQSFAPADVGTEMFKKDNGVLVVRRKPVFRSGTFRDSAGIQSTWEPLHIDMMMNHFKMLRERNILSDVPVRDGHPGWIMSGQEGNGKVIGWHTDLGSEELEIAQGKFTFLLADYELTDEEGKAKEQSGTYRNRSSEIGEYHTNDEAMFWPVYMGVAMVDFSAVEGLNFSKFSATSELKTPEGRVFHVFMDEKEAPAVSGAQALPTGQAAPAAPPVVPVVPAAPAAQHAAPVTQPLQFTLNGAVTTDFAAVQTHINTLEQFRQETETSAVESFVRGLATPEGGNKLLASAVEATLVWAKTQNPEQFTAWKALQEATPAHPIVGQQFGNTNQANEGNGAQPNQATADMLQEYEDACAIVRMHQRGNMKQADIEKLPSWVKMKALEPQVQAAQAQS